MNNKHSIWLLFALLASGCAQQPQVEAPQSFAMAEASGGQQTTTAKPASDMAEETQPPLATETAKPKASTQPSAAPAPEAAASGQPQAAQNNAVDATISTTAAQQIPAATPVVNSQQETKAAETSPVPTAEPEPKPEASPEAGSNAAADAASSDSNEIQWSEFFDDDKQNTPSEKFWDMSGQTATIKGFMGEVLSFEKHWFLLIPEPGAECPFDNGDETYWNKIMIVFVPDSEKLRFTPGPLQITGRLDVGIKIDESGYKTMFRLYNAKVEKIKE